MNKEIYCPHCGESWDYSEDCCMNPKCSGRTPSYIIPENASVSTPSLIKESPEFLNKKSVIKESEPDYIPMPHKDVEPLNLWEQEIWVCTECHIQYVNPLQKYAPHAPVCPTNSNPKPFIPLSTYHHLQAQNRKLKDALEEITKQSYTVGFSTETMHLIAKSALEESK